MTRLSGAPTRSVHVLGECGSAAVVDHVHRHTDPLSHHFGEADVVEARIHGPEGDARSGIDARRNAKSHRP